jgi:hypothetical protein
VEKNIITDYKPTNCAYFLIKSFLRIFYADLENIFLYFKSRTIVRGVKGKLFPGFIDVLRYRPTLL